ncbi:MAG: 50S ribosomal protein L11 methyltransferase, partial [Bacteroidales bacterium]|nr:50S ribosomal protein L11 methyltransferase [Bacteroidales bacterium]
LLAYMKESDYDEDNVRQLLKENPFGVEVNYSASVIEAQNWNALWESNYSPVLIADRCYIRAPFHPHRDDVDFEIVIEPKMSFGTAHHETTSLMIEYVLEEPLAGKELLDMGAGTGVLAILSRMRGASPVTAIDNDEWAYENNIENNARNGVSDIRVILGDASALHDMHYDVIIANINRNILLRDMQYYIKVLNDNGIIFFSGFYQGEDLDAIKAETARWGLEFVSNKEKNKWVAAKFQRR